jgi:hypothetical protein
MRNEELDAKCCTASSGVSLVSAARQEPQKWPLLEEGKLALASVGAMRNEKCEEVSHKGTETQRDFFFLCAFVPLCEVLLQKKVPGTF